jgi:hypothetical protein
MDVVPYERALLVASLLPALSPTGDRQPLTGDRRSAIGDRRTDSLQGSQFRDSA